MGNYTLVARSAVVFVIYHRKLRTSELPHMFSGVSNRRSGSNELKCLGARFTANQVIAGSDKTPQQKGKVATKNPFQGMRFVHYHCG